MSIKVWDVLFFFFNLVIFGSVKPLGTVESGWKSAYDETELAGETPISCAFRVCPNESGIRSLLDKSFPS
jgi:hypothetical protein